MNTNNLYLLVLAIIVEMMGQKSSNPAAERKPTPVGITTDSGKPVDEHEANGTLNVNLLNNNFYLLALLHVSQERIPERVVHAKGAGAFGFFEVTHNVSHICKAKLFSTIGKRTPIAARFSPAAIEKGGTDTTRDNRGFAVKFYTEEGNWDFVGCTSPMFVIKDPIHFPSLVHSLKRNPATNLFDPNMFWDMHTLKPEALHFLIFIFGDRGIPDGYRYMPGFSIHTYQVVNDNGESFFVRFQFTPDKGIKHIFSEKAKCLGGEEPDYAVKDLYNAIAEGHFPSWTCNIQVLTMQDVNKADFDVFDITRILPEDKYPLRPVGRMVLNMNPVNYFADIEQLAFSPFNLVPGILGAPDKMFEARRLSYRDAQNYRLGGNLFNIPVNCPINGKTYTYNRDGRAPVYDNQGNAPNYFPNSFSGPVPYFEKNKTRLIKIIETPPYNLDQSRSLYYSYTPDERKRLVRNIVASLKLATTVLQERAVSLFGSVDEQLGETLWLALLGNSTESL